MMKLSLSLLSMLLVFSPVQLRSTWAQDSQPAPALFCTDALGRSLPVPSDVREFRKDRHVGIFYFTWLNLREIHDNTRILPSLRKSMFR